MSRLSLVIVTLQLCLQHSWIAGGMRSADNQIVNFNSVIGPTIDPTQVCSQFTNFTEQQKGICSRYPHATASAMQGINLALHECRRQFTGSRWNCTNLDERVSNDHPFLRRGYRETSFAHAITAAGVLHQIARACSIGKIQSCGCERGEDFEWTGCSHDLGFGAKYSRKFLQNRQEDQGIQTMMQAHNMKLGRKAVIDKKITKCKCHGMSSSCEMKTCWLSTPDFREVGDRLKALYDQSVKVDRTNTVENSYAPYHTLFEPAEQPASIGDEPNLKKSMVFYEKSPSYCATVDGVGVYGTSGRVCNLTSTASDSCTALCCGRGYFTVQVRRVEKCDCEFFWCCYVICQRCERDEWVTICK